MSDFPASLSGITFLTLIKQTHRRKKLNFEKASQFATVGVTQLPPWFVERVIFRVVAFDCLLNRWAIVVGFAGFTDGWSLTSL